MLDCKNILVKRNALHLSGREIAKELDLPSTAIYALLLDDDRRVGAL